MKFARDKEQYIIGAAIGTAENATIYRGKHKEPSTGDETPVRITIFDMVKIEQLYSFYEEVRGAKTYHHENMVKIHSSFTAERKLWIVTPLLSGMSVRSMIRSTFRRGLPEKTVFFILKEALKALDYMHGEKNEVHLSVGADCIFLDEEYSGVKLVTRLLSYVPNNESPVDFPEWAVAPEVVIDLGKENGKRADVWMFGLLALELFYGEIPAGFGLWKKENNRSGFLEKMGCFSEPSLRKKMPEDLREVVAACLTDVAWKRPTTSQLMEFKLFQKNIPVQCLAKLVKACKKAN